MKKAINAWSVERNTEFEEMFQQIKAAGFDGIELNIDTAGHSAHSLTIETTSRELADIRALSEKYRLPVVSISSSLYGISLGSPKPELQKFAKQLLEKQLICASALDAEGILIVPDGITPDVSIQKAYDTVFKTLSSMKSMINEFQINVGMENIWNGFFMSPFDMAHFIDRLDSPYIGAYYDVGNVVAFSWPEYWIEILGNRIRNVHVKNFKRTQNINSGGRFIDLMKGDIDWSTVIPALKKTGFDGYLTGEVFIDDYEFPIPTHESFYKMVAGQIDTIITDNQ